MRVIWLLIGQISMAIVISVPFAVGALIENNRSDLPINKRITRIECRLVMYEDGSTTFRNADDAYYCMKHNHAYGKYNSGHWHGE